MALDSSVNLDTLFIECVNAVATVDEPWVALSILAKSPALPSNQPARLSRDDRARAVDNALDKVRILNDATRVAGVLSSNDSLDDISTSSIKFLLIPFLTSRTLASWQGDQEGRLEKLRQAREHLVTFFTTIDNLCLLDANDRTRILDDSVEVAMSASQKREQKIARFKAEKEAERKLKLIMERRATHGENNDVDEEAERDAVLTILQSAVRKGLDDVESIDSEIALLRFAKKQYSKGVDPREMAQRERHRAPTSVVEGMPPTFQIVNKRENIRQGVFRPDHSLPTYTVEEWGEIELANAVKREQNRRDAEVVKARRAEEEDSDGDEAADRETVEKRRWDDWKDEHNRGSGNTMR